MSVFKKRGPDVIDFTDLQKRGLLKAQPQEKMPYSYKGETLDLTKTVQKINPLASMMADSQKPAEIPSIPEPSPNPLGFFDTSKFDSNFAPTQTPSFSLPETSNPLATFDSPKQTAEEFASKMDLQHLSVKFEDLEYKLERLTEKLVKIEQKLSI